MSWGGEEGGQAYPLFFKQDYPPHDDSLLAYVGFPVRGSLLEARPVAVWPQAHVGTGEAQTHAHRKVLPPSKCSSSWEALKLQTKSLSRRRCSLQLALPLEVESRSPLRATIKIIESQAFQCELAAAM